MTPSEIDLLHIRLQQIGEVLAKIANSLRLTDPRTWDLIDDVQRGMNRP